MAPPKKKIKDLSASAKYYRDNPAARRTKAATDKKVNARPEQKKKRSEAGSARYAAKKNGKNVTGKDASHTSRGIVFKDSSKNRGSKSDSNGDKRARGKK
jgi:hypothetical protein